MLLLLCEAQSHQSFVYWQEAKASKAAFKKEGSFLSFPFCNLGNCVNHFTWQVITLWAMERHLPAIFQMPPNILIVCFNDHFLCWKLFLCDLCWLSIFHMTTGSDGCEDLQLKPHLIHYFCINRWLSLVTKYTLKVICGRCTLNRKMEMDALRSCNSGFNS